MIKFLIASLIAVGCVLGLVGAGISAFLITTPRPTNIRDCITTSMFNVKLCPDKPGYVKLKDISIHARNAVIVSEDGAFFIHHGVDWYEMQESFNKNWEKGEFARGGSTITQQLAKNVYLSSEKSVLRKLREILIAVQLEKILSKDEILEKYLNVVEFGDGIFGIGAASRHYFSKHPSQLSISEGAFLAFLLPSPKKYAVSFQKKKLTPFARSQMRQIVTRLQKYKKISSVDLDFAMVEIDHFFGAGLEEVSPGIDPNVPSPEELEFEGEVFETL